MTGKIVVVTPPDDTLLDGFRILSVNLDTEQSKMLSDTLLEIESEKNIILYVYQIGNPITWLLDKHTKADLILFNANTHPDGMTELLIGYIAAQHNSYYFGTLKDLHHVNDRVIYSTEDLGSLFERKMKRK